MKSKKSDKIYKVNNDIFNDDDFMKDCPNYDFLPTIIPPVKRIIAIGDIHGDLDLAIRSFKLAGLIDDKFNWIAKPPETVVVQVGDQIDSCRPIPEVYECHLQELPDDKNEDMSVLDFFNDMHKKAKRAGGAVYSLLGNHELMNSEGKFAYVSHKNYHNFNFQDDNGNIYNGSSGRKNAFKPGGPVSKMLACTRNSVIIVGSTMFVHAGVLPVLAEKMDYLNIDNETKLKYLNSIVRKWLLHKFSDKDSLEKILIGNSEGTSPFWTRIFGNIPTNTDMKSTDCSTSIKKTIEVFKIGRMVVGHTPQMFTNKDGINGTCYESDGNKLYRVDGGFSRAFKVFGDHNVIQVLEIIDDNKFTVYTDSMIHKYQDPIITSINEKEMDTVSAIYSQNRNSPKRRKYKHTRI